MTGEGHSRKPSDPGQKEWMNTRDGDGKRTEEWGWKVDRRMSLPRRGSTLLKLLDAASWNGPLAEVQPIKAGGTICHWPIPSLAYSIFCHF